MDLGLGCLVDLGLGCLVDLGLGCLVDLRLGCLVDLRLGCLVDWRALWSMMAFFWGVLSACKHLYLAGYKNGVGAIDVVKLYDYYHKIYPILHDVGLILYWSYRFRLPESVVCLFVVVTSN